MSRAIIIVMAAALLAVAAYVLVYTRPLESDRTSPPPAAAANFREIGNIVKNNPGLKPGAWHLVYDEPGAPGRSVELVFTNDSSCENQGSVSACDPNTLTIGGRVEVEGQKIGGLVTVVTLRTR